MADKKVNRGLSKFVMAVIIASSVSVVAYAKEGDIYNADNENKGGIANIFLNDRNTLFDMISNLNKYTYEVNGMKYNASEVNNKFNANPTMNKDVIHGLIKKDLQPVAVDLEVIDIF